MEYKKIISKKDVIIPEGTIFECIDGRNVTYANGNYEALINLSKDNCGSFIIGSDFDKDNFDYIIDSKKELILDIAKQINKSYKDFVESHVVRDLPITVTEISILYNDIIRNLNKISTEFLNN